ncbi:MAG: efflux RND transporter periplasmic adaptor subunit [Xanthobacteraceae bacterium]|jgi:cobalt-zinc-cadmium efflux system membrane fusion protein
MTVSLEPSRLNPVKKLDSANVAGVDDLLARSGYRRWQSLFDKKVLMINHRLLFGIAAAVIAAGLGFTAGHSFPSASRRPPPAAPAVATTDPGLPTTIALSDAELASLQLQAENAKMGPLVRAVSATGSVGYDLLHLARIKPPARGRIESLDVTVGDRVTAGQRLAILDNFELSAAQSKVASAEAAVNQAKVRLATANADFDRATNLIRTGGIAQREVDTIRATAASAEAELRTREAELRQYHQEEARLLPVPAQNPNAGSPTDQAPLDARGAIVAPFAGVVDSVAVALGDVVDPSTPSFTVADLSTVWVEAEVAEQDLGEVQVGDTVQVRVSAFPERVFAGRVTYISDQLETTTGTAKVRCEVANPDGALRVNMFATATIMSPQGGDAILVPSSAVQEVNGQSVVFIPTGHGQFAWRTVHTGLIANGQTQITDGLAADTPVVADGSYWLKAALTQSTIPSEG